MDQQTVLCKGHRTLAADYKKLVDKVCKLEGFENFLQSKKLTELIPAATKGPVIMVNVHTSRCDALVLHSNNPSQPLIHIPLLDFCEEKADNLYSQMMSILTTYNDSRLTLQSILGNLWSWVVDPILSTVGNMLLLSNLIDDQLPHITWCPTGQLAFLPLHAAGIYGTTDASKNRNAFDLVVSSYTPTLTALVNSMATVNHATTLISPPRMLIVSQAKTPGQHHLPGTIKEAECIEKIISSKNCIHLEGEKATVSAVLREMGKNSWVHLACHGIQNIMEPLKSSFILHDGNIYG
ncbi:hypothetical protein M422DRAFT_272594 [Sphaerobolus stellatus SS14]|uniref:CHAT domain-containing protein n=1 Tax=Sphaerobolus stellatus (strain SS14) TaxID=990650 RepID=A0A0C9TX15_SPHS4|nr:hypothetical protein M422DRAFT_272594 [Sphaerobolus stellatus SS14]